MRFYTQANCDTLYTALRRASLVITIAAASASPTLAQTAVTQPDGKRPFLPFGTADFDIPPAVVRITVSSRQLELMAAATAAAAGTERISGIAQLGRCGPAAVPLVISYCRDTNPAVRAEAARALGNLCDPSAAAALTPLVKNSDPSVRREAVMTARSLHSSEIITMALNDTDDRVRRAALQGVTTPAQTDRVAVLLPVLPPSLLADAIDAMGRVDASPHVVAIVAALRGRPDVQVAALGALSQTGDSRLASIIRQSLIDPSPTVRRASLVALAKLAPPAEQQQLAVDGLNDPDPTVRAAAADLLRAHPTRIAVRGLADQLPTDNPSLHFAAREALVALGDPAVPVAERLLSDPLSARRVDGSYILGRLRSPASLDGHVALLEDANWTVVGQAAESLRNIPDSFNRVGPRIVSVIRRISAMPMPTTTAVDACASAILLAGQSHYEPIVALVRPMIPVVIGRDNAPEAMHRAAIWTVGVIADAHSTAADDIRNIMATEGQSPPAIVESIKARINMNDASSAGMFDAWKTDPALNTGETCRWISHWAADYFHKQHTPFEPATYTKTVTLSVAEIRP